MRINERVQVGTETIINTIMVDDFNEDGELVGQHEETVTREVPITQEVYRDMTPEEEAQAAAEQAAAEEHERTRPLTSEERMDAIEDALVELAAIMTEGE